jgi:signal peptidase I
MEGTLRIGDHLLVDKLSPAGEIKRGDLITFRYPLNLRETYVKRVIGLPGDHIRLIDKQVSRNGQRLLEPYAQHVTSYIDAYRDNFPATPPAFVSQRARDMLAHNVVDGEVIVPPGSLFVLGDNRDDSADSRYWGFVPREDLIGRPVLVYWSYDAPWNEVRQGKMPTHFFTRTRWNRTLLRLR